MAPIESLVPDIHGQVGPHNPQQTEVARVAPKSGTTDIRGDIALSLAPEVTSSYVTTWVRVGVNRAQALYDTVVSSVFHTIPF